MLTATELKPGGVYRLDDGTSDPNKKRPFQLTKYPNDSLPKDIRDCLELSIYCGDEFMVLETAEVEDSFFIHILALEKALVGWLYVCETWEIPTHLLPAITKIK